MAPGQMPSDGAAAAGRMAMEHAGVRPEQVGLLINTSVCRDFVEPSTASIVHAKLGLRADCLNFDLANACLGFIDGLALAGRLVERGEIGTAVVVAGENSRHVVEATLGRLNTQPGDRDAFKLNLATLTLGSGAAAMVVAPAAAFPARPRLTGMVVRADTASNHLCRGNETQMTTDSVGLLAAGVELGRITFAAAQLELGWTTTNLDHAVLHQVSGTHTDRVLATLGLPGDLAHRVYPRFGNIGPAAVPITFSKAVELGRIHPGQRIALMGIGSGLNCAMAEIQW